ncbi:beta-catenin-like protein 1 [Zootermopsis nevadensis]|uniref:Beta-catenin-like protein 1 n=1 Tax=Zootermopsis nevadensis TaxID=136037 RepID=A0A067R1X8_ZOONE|nr:beta-catenin-like protein 1 [Zootermopsis nevadensis]XP_021934254.1 beta-catenin-like protein 1 [Zootermopsis nevadensis]XP_021934255.1 beta-catenin-like protein 1 [Zootermopsis nevadensis]KDR11648.1 Beta-catenin-like protein 1 [Zootermopsis nevadensis]
MDIGELLSYKPPNTPKRVQDDDNEEEDFENEFERQRKMRKLAKSRATDAGLVERTQKAQQKEPEEAVRAEKPLTDEEREKILKLVESEEFEGEVLDESTLKRLVLLFEKRALRNQEMRIKFPDMPEKFMESELELHETIQEMHVVATVPDLYPIMVELQAVPSLLELLAHENTDVAVAVVDLLQELTDVDILHESEEGADSLIDALLNQQICALLVQNLERLDESVKEESEGVHNTLAIFENLAEFRPDLCGDAAKQGLLQWLLRRLRVKLPFDANKLYASEILSILLQDTPDNRQMLGDLDGIDVILQQLAFYKRHDPTSSEEHEMMENLFNCLCGSLMYAPNRECFLRGEGLQLMNLMLREKKLSRNGSLKVLDHAMSGPDGKENCNKFVDILGLRTIFPLFMKTPKKNRRRILTTEEHEEHVVSIIASMLRNCRGPQRQRLLSKFTENDHEKVDRLLELHFKYLEKVEEVDLEIDHDRRDLDEGDEDAEEERNYLRRLEGGLFTLQLVDYILLEVCTGGPSTIKQRVTQILNLRGGSLKTIRHVMREYAGNLGDAGDTDWREMEQQHILQLVDKF